MRLLLAALLTVAILLCGSSDKSHDVTTQNIVTSAGSARHVKAVESYVAQSYSYEELGYSYDELDKFRLSLGLSSLNQAIMTDSAVAAVSCDMSADDDVLTVTVTMRGGNYDEDAVLRTFRSIASCILEPYHLKDTVFELQTE